MKRKYLSENQIKKIQLDLLSVFDKFCDDNDLSYSLGYGTMLGAIRHKGFIPWDDDIDVVMMRDQYDKFIRLTKDNKISNRIIFECPENSDSVYPFGKLYNTKYKIEANDGDTYKGIWIDVFPIDCIQNTKINLMLVKIVRNILRPIIIAKLYRKQTNKGFIKHTIKILIKAILFVFPITCFRNIIVFLSKKINYLDLDSHLGLNFVWGYGTKEIMDYSDLYNKNLSLYEFEGKKFKGVSNYDYYLKTIYGNYMVLPPVDKRVKHGFKAYVENME